MERQKRELTQKYVLWRIIALVRVHGLSAHGTNAQKLQKGEIMNKYYRGFLKNKYGLVLMCQSNNLSYVKRIMSQYNGTLLIVSNGGLILWKENNMKVN